MSAYRNEATHEQIEMFARQQVLISSFNFPSVTPERVEQMTNELALSYITGERQAPARGYIL